MSNRITSSALTLSVARSLLFFLKKNVQANPRTVHSPELVIRMNVAVKPEVTCVYVVKHRAIKHCPEFI